MYLFVSGKNSNVITVATMEIPPAIKNGTDVPNPSVKAEIAGPKTNPNPNDAPIMANPRALSLGSVVSEMTADATGIFPAVIPSNARARKRKIALGANARTKNDKAVPAIDITRRGFLPYLSESLPIMGADKKAHKENSAKRRLFWKSDKPNFSEYG